MDMPLAGTYAILQENLDPVDVTEVGRVLSEIRRIPLADATRLARHAYGVVDEGVPFDEAREIEYRLGQMGVPVFLVEMSEFRPYPHPVRTRNADCMDDSLHVQLPDGSTEFVNYQDVVLLSGGRLNWEESVRIVESEKGMGLFSKPHAYEGGLLGAAMKAQYGGSSAFHRKYRRTRVEKMFFRILCERPSGSFEIDKDEFNYDYLEARKAMDTASNMRLFLKDLVDRSSNVLLGQNVAAYLEGDLRSLLKFGCVEDFEEYNQWLFHWCYHVQDQNEPD